MKSLFRRFFMPYLTGPACILTEACGDLSFPATSATCECRTSAGGVNELYFIPCTSTFSQANVLDTAWWQAFLDAETLGRSGIGLGSIGKKSSKSDRKGSCRVEEITQIVWALKFQIKCIDKTSARTTQKKVNELLTKGDKYLVLARMCEGDEDVLPIGQFDTTDLNWTVPDNFEENQVIEIELSWKEFGIPIPETVAGLATILPKAK